MTPLPGAENLAPPKPRPAPPAYGSASTTGQTAFSSNQPVELASRSARFGARLIDTVILFGFAFGVLLVLHFTDVKPLPVDEPYDSYAFEVYVENMDEVLWAIAAVAALYEIALTAIKGQTLGKMATRTLVVREEDMFQPEMGRPPSWGKSFLRWALPTVLGLPALFLPFIGNILWLLCYLSLMWDRDRQGWHDKVAKTFVVTKL